MPKNAFNSINRRVLIRNLKVLCPDISIFAENLYSIPARLFVAGGMKIVSEEGTTQGCPLSMPSYAIGLLPLMMRTGNYEESSKVKQSAYADDVCGAGRLKELKRWWEIIVKYGPCIGYFAEPKKSWMIVKPEHKEQAVKLFGGSDINKTQNGNKHLGAAIGTENFKDSFVEEKVEIWVKQVEELSKIAWVDPHLAYSAFIHGL